MEWPHTLQSDEASAKFPASLRDDLAARAREHGAVLLRGWNFDVRDFAELAQSLGEPLRDMSCSAGPRLEVLDGVHTANEAPPSESIPFHHEMAQCCEPPEFVLFYCETPPTSGGATPIIQSTRMAAELQRQSPPVAQKIREKHIRYVRELPGETDMSSPLGKSWRATLHVTTRKEAEDVLLAQGFAWEWLSDDRLRTIGPKMPMFIKRRGRETLFTAAETVFLEKRTGRPEKSFVYGDGSPLGPDGKAAFVSLGKFAFDESVHVPWRRGDVLIIDNATVMHARDAFVPPRRILVALVGRLAESTARP